ncbi:MAG: nicotinate (nicotinamide) nucleotide adenylyltransferase [Acidobacteriota bacterium]
MIQGDDTPRDSQSLVTAQTGYDEAMNQPTSASPALRSGLRAAFFGGSFDPPHLGHLAVARAARAALELDTVLFAPVGAQPLKPHGASASFEDRVAMTRLAIAGEAGFAISLADAPKPSGVPNFTVETLAEVRAALPAGSELFCLMGADSFAGMRHWHRAADVPFAAPLIVASRPGQQLDDLQAWLPPGCVLESESRLCEVRHGVEVHIYFLVNAEGGRRAFYLLPDLDVEISASEIRGRIHALQAEGELLPAAVSDYVRAHGLYH